QPAVEKLEARHDLALHAELVIRWLAVELDIAQVVDPVLEVDADAHRKAAVGANHVSKPKAPLVADVAGIEGHLDDPRRDQKIAAGVLALNFIWIVAGVALRGPFLGFWRGARLVDFAHGLVGILLDRLRKHGTNRPLDALLELSCRSLAGALAGHRERGP